MESIYQNKNAVASLPLKMLFLPDLRTKTQLVVCGRQEGIIGQPDYS